VPGSAQAVGEGWWAKGGGRRVVGAEYKQSRRTELDWTEEKKGCSVSQLWRPSAWIGGRIPQSTFSPNIELHFHLLNQYGFSSDAWPKRRCFRHEQGQTRQIGTQSDGRTPVQMISYRNIFRYALESRVLRGNKYDFRCEELLWIPPSELSPQESRW